MQTDRNDSENWVGKNERIGPWNYSWQVEFDRSTGSNGKSRPTARDPIREEWHHRLTCVRRRIQGGISHWQKWHIRCCKRRAVRSTVVYVEERGSEGELEQYEEVLRWQLVHNLEKRWSASEISPVRRYRTKKHAILPRWFHQLLPSLAILFLSTEVDHRPEWESVWVARGCRHWCSKADVVPLRLSLDGSDRNSRKNNRCERERRRWREKRQEVYRTRRNNDFDRWNKNDRIDRRCLIPRFIWPPYLLCGCCCLVDQNDAVASPSKRGKRNRQRFYRELTDHFDACFLSAEHATFSQ